MKRKDSNTGIEVMSADTTTDSVLNFGQDVGKSAIQAENREAAFAGAVLAIGLTAGIAYAFELFGLGISAQMTATLIMMTAIFGVIEIPRLNLVGEMTRLILLMLIIGEMALFTKIISSQYGISVNLIYGGALMLLFAASIVNATVQQSRSNDSTVESATINRHTKDAGLMGGVLLFVALLV